MTTSVDSPVRDTNLPSSDVVVKVFRNNKPNLIKLLSSNVTDFCNRLESALLIEEEVAEDLLTTLGVGNLDKATKLAIAIRKSLNVENEAVINFAKLCGILLQYRTAETFARNLMAEAGLKEEDMKQLQKLDSQAVPTPSLVNASSSRDYSEFTTANYGEPKLRELLHYVTEIPDMWDSIGIQLELSQSQLNAIRMKTSNGGIPQKYFVDVFTQWEDSSSLDVPYSWRTFLEALSCPFVNKPQLANRVAAELRKKKRSS